MLLPPPLLLPLLLPLPLPLLLAQAEGCDDHPSAATTPAASGQP